jgi:hypothetical protein
MGALHQSTVARPIEPGNEPNMVFRVHAGARQRRLEAQLELACEVPAALVFEEQNLATPEPAGDLDDESVVSGRAFEWRAGTSRTSTATVASFSASACTIC